MRSAVGIPLLKKFDLRRPRTARELKMRRLADRPLAPTKEMVEEHTRTHAEYRDWCPDRRAGKLTGLLHRRGDLDEENLGLLSAPMMRSDSTRKEREDDLISVRIGGLRQREGKHLDA